ncbi:MAG: SCP2 sterol-binding domain-containing protein [Lachnospiraceae bacterium]|nr:SCP2 sterol-binding domain-containing protein [Lachnospiraceae bacterium]
MKINIYYGGRGIVGDPTNTVITRMRAVLEDINVKVTRYNLYEEKRNISSLANTVSDCDGIILASTVEWHGTGGFMAEFLDALWLYGNKERIAEIYMCPVVMSTTYGEREGKLELAQAWEILGGKPCSGICGYVQDMVSFELNDAYATLVEKKAENMYRTISQKIVSLPASNQAVRQMVSAAPQIELTAQEAEQLSKYASDDNYVQTQKEDIRELASHFKTLMGNQGMSVEDMLIRDFKEHFAPDPSFSASYSMMIKDIEKPLAIIIKGTELDVHYGSIEKPSVICRIDKDKLINITAGAETFQRAFMTGDMQVKGEFKELRRLDSLFKFRK